MAWFARSSGGFSNLARFTNHNFGNLVLFVLYKFEGQIAVFGENWLSDSG